jgi:hypothetical protein
LTDADNIVVCDGTNITGYLIPWPASIDINLYIKAKTQTECWAIVEQILPHFRPMHFINYRPLPEVPSYVVRKPILFDSISWSDDNDGSFGDKREIEFTLGFRTQVDLFANALWQVPKDTIPPGYISNIHLNKIDATDNTTLETFVLWVDGSAVKVAKQRQGNNESGVWIMPWAR